MENRHCRVVAFGPGLLRLPPWVGRRGPDISRVLLTGSTGDGGLNDRSAEEVLSVDGWETDDLLARSTAGLRCMVDEELGGQWWGGPPAHFSFDALGIAIPGTNRGDADRLVAMLTECEQICRPESLLLLAGADCERGEPLGRRIAHLQQLGATVLSRDVDPWALFHTVSVVHTVAHDIGFLALMAGKRVVCHGPAFFAGWGLTEDRPAVPSRHRQRTLAEVFAARVLLSTRYHNPYTGEAASFEEALDIVRQCRRLDRMNRGIAVCVGMAFWKQSRIAAFFRTAEGPPRFIRSTRKAVAVAAAAGGGIAVWASREPAGLAERAATAGVPVIRVEDGFIRSAGLGADFIPPASITLDADGLYCDPTRPSGLERILDSIELDEPARERARRLITLLVSQNITKYAAGTSDNLELPAGRTILVPGQVEDDRSVLLGGAGIRSNFEVLRRVREANPGAYILYKPHPDVDAGHRPGAVDNKLILRHADRIVRGGSTAELIMAVDEVHCLTSLAGFEALLRGKQVVVYGQPFYAGWGLTTDVNPPPRRGRRLTLEHLVAGTLIAYARYLDPLTQLPCGPEVLIARFADHSLWQPTPLIRLRRLQGRITRRFRSLRWFRPTAHNTHTGLK